MRTEGSARERLAIRVLQSVMCGCGAQMASSRRVSQQRFARPPIYTGFWPISCRQTTASQSLVGLRKVFFDNNRVSGRCHAAQFARAGCGPNSDRRYQILMDGMAPGNTICRRRTASNAGKRSRIGSQTRMRRTDGAHLPWEKVRPVKWLVLLEVPGLRAR